MLQIPEAWSWIISSLDMTLLVFFLLTVEALPERGSHKLRCGRGSPTPAGCSLIPSRVLPGVFSLTLGLQELFPVTSRAVLAAGAGTAALQLLKVRMLPFHPGIPLEPSANTVGWRHCLGCSCPDGPPALLSGFQISSRLHFFDSNAVYFLHISSFLGGVLVLLSMEKKTHLQPEFYNSNSDNVCSLCFLEGTIMPVYTLILR